MESSSTSTFRSHRNERGLEIPGRLCHCGSIVRMFTSRTQQNPGRRFLLCPGSCGERCDFFEWVDQFGCDRATMMIPGVMVHLNQFEGQHRLLESEINRLREENSHLLESFVHLQAANKALLYKSKLVLICAIVCLSALVWYM
ncbi:hypothetical protein ACJIZ3_003639 [Penstemon smallii]|uniref:GRF-type domain-containing protein n=1 Tax=Penstemon smallii TaxID=265156 RepID=A0ABD3UBD8_9LAMI